MSIALRKKNYKEVHPQLPCLLKLYSFIALLLLLKIVKLDMLDVLMQLWFLTKRKKKKEIIWHCVSHKRDWSLLPKVAAPK